MTYALSVVLVCTLAQLVVSVLLFRMVTGSAELAKAEREALLEMRLINRDVTFVLPEEVQPAAPLTEAELGYARVGSVVDDESFLEA